MSISKHTRKYWVGQQVEAVVDSVHHFGVFARLPDGTKVFLRRREMSLSGEIDPHDIVKKGEKIQGKVLKLAERERLMELSYRATLPDPWPDFVKRHREGDIVQGRVKQLFPDGVQVEIQPGINGWVPFKELAPWTVEKPEDVMWKDDEVEAVITHLSSINRRIELSVRERLLNRAKAESVWEEIIAIKEQAQPASSEEISRSSTKTGAASLSLSILIVDDHDDISESYAELLVKKGYEAKGVTALSAARAALQQKEYGILFLDINLSDQENGLEFIAQLKTKRPDVIVAIMSIPEAVERREREIEALGIQEVFFKPFDLRDIEDFLLRVGSEEPLTYWQGKSQAPTPTEIGDEDVRAYLSSARPGQSLAQRIERHLRRLQRETKADAVFLFQMDIVSRDVTIFARAVSSHINEHALYLLEKSPVWDVIEDNALVFESNATEKLEKFSNLLKLLPFESCIGVPIWVREEAHSALFLFSRTCKAFSRLHLKNVLATGYILSAALENEMLLSDMRQINALLVSGQLALSLSHEVGNKTTGIDGRLRALRWDCEELVEQRPDLVELEQYRKMRQRLDDLLETSSDLKKTVTLFQQLLRPGGMTSSSINEVLQQTLMLLQASAHRHGVTLRFHPGRQLPPVPGSMGLLQQVFYNIVLNGIQHLSSSPVERGVITISSQFIADDARPVKVRISDNGLGVHKALWERIFHMGFTTRSEGSGLGLFLARNLVESLGGVVRVESSFIPGGTTFLVALPVSETSKENTP